MVRVIIYYRCRKILNDQFRFQGGPSVSGVPRSLEYIPDVSGVLRLYVFSRSEGQGSGRVGSKGFRKMRVRGVGPRMDGTTGIKRLQ